MRVPHSFAHFANEWALDCRKTLDRTAPDFQRPFLKLHPHRSCLSITIRPETAPLPLFGQFHQSPLHRVPVHIAQLLDLFACAPHIEIIEALLPNRFPHPLPESSLRERGLLSPAVHAPRETL